MTIVAPTTISTTYMQDGQATAAITPGAVRVMNTSLAGMNVNTVTTSRQFLSTDFGQMWQYNSTAPGSFTITTAASQSFDTGSMIAFRRVGTGQLTVTQALTTVTVNTATSYTTRTTGSAGSVMYVGGDTWWVDGDMT